jgi:hypothetical protein
VNNGYINNWTSQQNLTGHVLRLNSRVAEAITQSDRVSFNVYRYITSSPQPLSYNSPLLNTTWDCTCNNAWVGSADYTHIWNSTLVMDLNMGFFRYAVLRNRQAVSGTIGIASLPINQMPQITDPGFSNIGSDTTTSQVNTTNTLMFAKQQQRFILNESSLEHSDTANVQEAPLLNLKMPDRERRARAPRELLRTRLLPNSRP